MRWILALPLLALVTVLVLFVVTNDQTVEIGLWPVWTPQEGVTLPLSLAILTAMGGAFVLGALITWVAGIRARLRARRAEASIRALEKQIAALTAAMPQTTTTALPAA